MEKDIVESKESFLDKMQSYRPDLMYPETWKDVEVDSARQIVRTSANTKAAMYSSIPMTCTTDCPVKETCPLAQQGKQPFGMKCPFETAYVIEIGKSLMEELGVDETNFTEMSMIRSMVDQEIQMMRASNILGKEGFIQENMVGVDNHGNPIMKKELHIAVELQDRIHKRMKTYRSELLASREARSKAGQTELSTAQNVSKILDRVREIDQANEELRRKKLGIVDVDEYTESLKKKES